MLKIIKVKLGFYVAESSGFPLEFVDGNPKYYSDYRSALKAMSALSS